MAKPNYKFEKRQRELAKQKKKEDKKLRKQERTGSDMTEETETIGDGDDNIQPDEEG